MRLYKAITDFVQHYRSLFLNPAGNTIEIMILTAILVVGAIILWLGGGMLVNWVRQAVRRFRALERPLLTVGLIAGAALALLLVAAGATYRITSSPSFCGRLCHSMNPEFQSWRRSDHKDVACAVCHVDNSARALVYGRFKLLLHGVTAERKGGYKKPINAKSAYGTTQVPDERCRRCHEADKGIDADSVNLVVRHDDHSKSGIRCTACHNRVAHSGAEKYAPLAGGEEEFAYRDFTSMADGCLRCHREGGRFVRPNGRVAVGPAEKANGKPVRTDCDSCHPRAATVKLKEDAGKVHELHLKERSWEKGAIHGEKARQVGFGTCQVCHSPADRCTECHQGITMPHEENWVSPSNHGARAKAAKGRPCRLCHSGDVGTVPTCSSNGHHHKPFVQEYEVDLRSTDWANGKEAHGAVVKGSGANKCLQCHTRKTWCATQCHQGIAMPHDSGWRQAHFKDVELSPGAGWRRDRWRRKEAPCVLCHDDGGPEDDYCNNCHHQRFGSNSLRGLMARMATEYGVTGNLTEGVRLPCEDCHVHEGLTSCNDCHRRLGMLRGI